MLKNPNPQGKGLAPVLETLAHSRAGITVPPKYIEQVSNELFTSLFVLHSQFQFKPVIGRSYWLYRQQEKFRLSLIAPHEWGGTAFGQYIGECVLQADITWTLSLDEAVTQDAALLSLIEKRRQQFEDSLQNAGAIDDVLPFYLAALPFYQRVFASALASSLKTSMQKSGIQGLSYRAARGLLTQA